MQKKNRIAILLSHCVLPMLMIVQCSDKVFYCSTTFKLKKYIFNFLLNLVILHVCK